MESLGLDKIRVAAERLRASATADDFIVDAYELSDYGGLEPAVDPIFTAISSFYWSSTSDVGPFADPAIVISVV